MPRRQLPSQSKPHKIVLDWRAYFVSFCQVHGEPVHYQDLLLFRDGWRYSSREYEGPEYPPPENPTELDRMVVTYWLTRMRAVEEQVNKLKFDLKNVERLTQLKSLPLYQVVVAEDEAGKQRRGYRKVDTGPLRERIKWMVKDIRECVERLKEIEDYYRKQGEFNGPQKD